MPTCLIGLGSNLGNRRQHLEQALQQLGHPGDVQIERVSAFRETRPIGGPAHQPPFLNACARLQTALSPHALLLRLHAIEQQAGRERRQHWGARTLDLDLLLYDERVISDEHLRLPHPLMAFRRFVLEPAAEIAAELVHPEYRRTVSQLAERLHQTPQFVCLAGGTASARAETARQLAARVSGTLLTFEDAIGHPSGSEPTSSVSTGHTAMAANESVDTSGCEPPQGCNQVDPGHAMTSRPFARELEFLRQSSQAIAAASPTELTGPQWLVCDFWWEQVLLMSRHRLESADWATMQELAAGIRPNHPQPRLLAVLPDSRHHRSLQAMTWVAEVADEGELASHAEQVDQFPLLWVAGLTQDDAVLEIATAMEAMQ